MLDYHYNPDRFWSKVEKTETCWNWTASKVGNGYAQFHTTDTSGKYRQRYAHRVSFESVHGPIPEGMFVDHTCHNRICVNPEHLRLVTVKQNQENLIGGRGNSATGVRGVSWNKRDKCYRVVVGHYKTIYRGGQFKSLEEAAKAAVALRNKLFTHNDVDRRAS